MIPTETIGTLAQILPVFLLLIGLEARTLSVDMGSLRIVFGILAIVTVALGTFLELVFVLFVIFDKPLRGELAEIGTVGIFIAVLSLTGALLATNALDTFFRPASGRRK